MCVWERERGNICFACVIRCVGALFVRRMQPAGKNCGRKVGLEVKGWPDWKLSNLHPVTNTTDSSPRGAPVLKCNYHHIESVSRLTLFPFLTWPLCGRWQICRQLRLWGPSFVSMVQDGINACMPSSTSGPTASNDPPHPSPLSPS